MINFLKENGWWIGLVLGLIGIIVSLYPNEIKSGLKKAILFVVKPNAIIIELLLVIIVLIVWR